MSLQRAPGAGWPQCLPSPSGWEGMGAAVSLPGALRPPSGFFTRARRCPCPTPSHFWPMSLFRVVSLVRSAHPTPARARKPGITAAPSCAHRGTPGISYSTQMYCKYSNPSIPMYEEKQSATLRPYRTIFMCSYNLYYTDLTRCI